jgi:hypothetical protein
MDFLDAITVGAAQADGTRQPTSASTTRLVIRSEQDSHGHERIPMAGEPTAVHVSGSLLHALNILEARSVRPAPRAPSLKETMWRL